MRNRAATPGLGAPTRWSRRHIALLGTAGLCAGLVASVSAVSPAAAVGLTVTTAADVVADDGVCSLREALEAADADTASGASAGECPAGAGADVITFGVPGPIVLAGTQLEAYSEVTINGGVGVTIDANGASRVLRVAAAGELTLDSLTLTGGLVDGAYGGAIRNDSGILTVIDSTVTGNLARKGGGISSSGGSVTVIRTSVSGNTVDPGFDARGGGIYASGGLFAVVGSTISGNVRVGFQGFGGGIYNEDAVFTVSGSTIADNEDGWGIVGADSVSDSTVTGNEDGGIRSGAVWRSTVSDNLGPGVSGRGRALTTVTDSVVSGNQGNGVEFVASVANSTISGNTRGVLGGTVTRSTITGNTVGVSNASVVDSWVTGNDTGIANSSGTHTVSGTLVSSNTGDGIRNEPLTFIEPWGCTFETTSATTVVSNSTVSGNGGRGIGLAAPPLGGFGAWPGDSYVTVEFATVTDNGGGIYAVVDTGGTLWEHCPPVPFDTVVDVSASIVTDNQGVDGDVSFEPVAAPSPFVSGGFNVIGGGGAVGAFNGPGDLTGVTDPGLGPLADNGGPTMTHLSAHDSPAVDRVTAAVGSDPAADQRAVSRPQGEAKDAGAVEREDLWVRPFGTVVAEGDAGSTTANAVVLLEDSAGNPATSIADVTVDFATVDVFPNPAVAQAGSDFVSTSGTLTIPAGASQATVPVEVLGDTDVEPPLLYGEWGLIAFSNVSPNARLNVGFYGLGLVIIIDDD